MRRSANTVPTDYSEFYTHYVMGNDSLVNGIIRKLMPYVTPQELEDLAMGTVLRAIEHKAIEKHDPAKANFGGTVFYVTRSVVTHYLYHKTKKDVLATAASLSNTDAEEFELGTYSIERLFAKDVTVSSEADSINGKLEATPILTKLYDFARTCLAKDRHTRDRSLLPLLELMAEGYNATQCAERLGVRPSTIGNWTNYLKEVATH